MTVKLKIIPGDPFSGHFVKFFGGLLTCRPTALQTASPADQTPSRPPFIIHPWRQETLPDLVFDVFQPHRPNKVPVDQAQTNNPADRQTRDQPLRPKSPRRPPFCIPVCKQEMLPDLLWCGFDHLAPRISDQKLLPPQNPETIPQTQTENTPETIAKQTKTQNQKTPQKMKHTFNHQTKRHIYNQKPQQPQQPQQTKNRPTAQQTNKKETSPSDQNIPADHHFIPACKQEMLPDLLWHGFCPCGAAHFGPEATQFTKALADQNTT